MRRTSLWMTLAAATACAGPHARFEDTPVVWYVDDDDDIPPPATREFAHIQYLTDVIVLRPLTTALELRDLEPAHDTNALDEVPNSTWFTNRIGVRSVSPEEAARGPVIAGPPQLPLEVIAGKGGGRNPGFIARDASGRRFVVKFDRKANPLMQTGTDVLVDRIFWTIGYNVPADTLVRFRRADLRLAKDAEITPKIGKPRAMTWADVDAILATSPRGQGGSYRASASEWLAGVPLGGIAPEGVRVDDPNDTLAHEHRRVLRGLRVFAAWLSHTDMKEDNFLDLYVHENGRRFVRHYLVDFGEALGGHQAEFGRAEDRWEYIVDWEKNGLALLALGLWIRPWERLRPTPWPSIGGFTAERFAPAKWREAYPFRPFVEMDPADAYWAAKIVMRFDRRLLTAIVAQAEFPADASAYLVDTLLLRAQAIGRTWIETVTALDAFQVVGDRLCAWDLGIVYGLAHEGVVERIIGKHVVARTRIGTDGRVCVPLPVTDDYGVLRLRVRRDDGARPILQVHVAGGDRPRVLGIIRSEGGPCMRGRGRPRCR